jgi:ribulose-5-phosphate 4-epimerase/fuculose-1-phosphate aldolase
MNRKVTSELKILATAVSKYCVGLEGNISGKVDSNSFLVKASGHSLQGLDDTDLITFDFNNTQLDSFNKKGSMELGFHNFLLSFPNIKHVAHTHPAHTVAVLCTEYAVDFANRRMFPDQVVFNGSKTCLVPYAKPGEELTELVKLHVDSFIKTEGYFPKLILLENHGVIACGSSIKECIIITDICEKAAEIYTKSLSIGNVHFLSDEQVYNLVKDEKEKYRLEQL